MYRTNIVRRLYCFALLMLVCVSGIAVVDPSQASTQSVQTSSALASLAQPRESRASSAPTRAQSSTPTQIPSGEIAVDTTWTEEHSPYIITPSAYGAYITVLDGVTLTIEPGVQVLLPHNALFTVFGTLQAIGTADKPILFQPTTVGATNFWHWIQLGGGTNLTDSDTTRLSYVTIEGGGYNTWTSVYVLQSSPTLDHITIRGAGGAGLYALGGSLTIDTAMIENNSEDGIYLSGTNLPRLLNVTVRNNSGVAVQQYPVDMSPTYRHLSFSGNGTDAVVIHSQPPAHYITTGRAWSFGQAGVPIYVNNLIAVNPGAFLSLEPGTELRFANGGAFSVAGSLYALGTPTAPIRLSAQTEQPGAWYGLSLEFNSRAVLQHCAIGYAGSSVTALQMRSSNAVIQNCRIHHSSKDGVQAQSRAQPILVNNQIDSNAFGLRNDQPTTVVDARNTWWGDPSGPYHPTLNPNGRGNAVSDGVLFDPWLRSPSEGASASNRLILDLGGPANVSPGQTVDYAVQYINQSAQTIENAVLMLALPYAAEYLENTGNGLFWPARHQVFWKLGTVAPGSSGFVSARVRYAWGLPGGYQETTLALLGGTNAGQDVFDVRPYLSYVPVEIVAERALTAAELQAERQQYPHVDQLYTQAVAEGFTFGSADSLTSNIGETQTRISFVKPQQDAALYIHRQEDTVVATGLDRTFYTVRDVNGGLRRDLVSGIIERWGSWAEPGLQSLSTQAEVNFGNCMENCVIEQVPGWLAGKASDTYSTIMRGKDCVECKAGNKEACLKCSNILEKVPFGSDIWDLGKCAKECRDDPKSHVCTEDKRECAKFFFGLFGRDEAVTTPCDQETGRYQDFNRRSDLCTEDQKCVEGPNGPACQGCAPSASPNQAIQTASAKSSVCALMAESGGACDSGRTTFSTAHDPNEKFGPTGDLVPGQPVTYTITYENEGAGRAYGVFVVDQLSEHFDERTLTLHSAGTFLTDTRTIIWDVGELAPKGEAGSTGMLSFTAHLKRNLPSGTAVTNQAVVHFPSVPEETATNSVINIIQPIAGVPQTVETQAERPVAIQLQARNSGAEQITYTIMDAPLYGTLSGAAPNLSYTPTPNYNGQDRFTFVVSNGTMTSRPAEVRIIVHPSSADTLPPEVLWTTPEHGAPITEIRSTPFVTDTIGPAYLPFLQAQFSETITAATLSVASVQLLDGIGRAVPISVSYDGTTNGAIIMLREPLRERTEYTLVLTKGIKDLIGNSLAADYRATFRTGPVDQPGPISQRVYLPLVRR